MKILDENNINSNRFEEKISFEIQDFYNHGILPFSILCAFQDASTKHAELLNVGFAKMIEKHLLWVTMRIKFEIVRQPKVNEMLKIVTYPSGKNMLEFDRDYVIYDINDNIIIKGQSKWCLIDSKSRKICKMIDDVKIDNNPPIFSEKFLKTESFEPINLPDLSYQISSNDIDNNGHTNNTIYAKILSPIINNISDEIKFFQINFLKESYLGDRIDIYQKVDENSILFLGKLCERETSFTAKVILKNQ